MIKKIMAVILAITLSALCACSNKMVKKVNEKGELGEDKLPEADTTTVDASQIPTYDLSNLPQSTTYISKEELESYYVRELNTRCLADYNDIKNGLNSFHREILLTKLITEEELFKLMSIIYIDEPLLFQMDSKYSYEMDEEGYVTKVYPVYTMSAMEYAQQYKSYMDNLKSFYNSAVLEGNTFGSTFNATEYNTETTIIKNYIVQSYNSNNTSSDSYINSESATMYSEARRFLAYARYVGLDCAVKIGIPTSEIQTNNIKTSRFNISELKDIHKYTTNSGKIYTVDYDFDNYCFWNVVKIEGEWYNIDLNLNTLISQKYENALAVDGFSRIYDDLYNEGIGINIDDYTMSMSKLMYINDQILGLSPVCDSVIFSQTYRDGQYVLKMISSQLIQFISKEINGYKNNSRATYFLYQFASEDNFNEFIEEFDNQINAYNEANKNSILSYQLDFDRSSLSVMISHLEYKN